MDTSGFYQQVGLPGELAYGTPVERPASLALSKGSDGRVSVPQGTKPLEFVRLAEEDDPGPREYVLDGLIPAGVSTTFYGDGGVAKSLLALSLCVAVSGKQPMWMGREAVEGPCLYLDFELTSAEQVRRVKALSCAEGLDGVPEGLLYASAVGMDSASAFWRAFDMADREGATIMVVDSYGLAMQGESNSAMDVTGFYLNYLKPFEAEGIAVLLVDHQAKGGTYQQRTVFGSAYKRNLVRSEIQIEALEQDELSGTLDLVFRHTKHNLGPRLRPFGAQVRFREDEIQVGVQSLDYGRMMTEEGVRPDERVLLALDAADDAQSAKDVYEATMMYYGTVSKVIRSLEARGKIKKVGYGSGNVPLYTRTSERSQYEEDIMASEPDSYTPAEDYDELF